MKHDLELTERLWAIQKHAGSINRLDRDRKELELFHALDQIEDEARKAKWRMNQLKADL